ncbi:DNA/RNA nuclease SfsA [Moritella marina ATCC 15381]|uniref:Sugar fermentation stimulation protein homolog n=1 Tax=Moritella marina ATCC 15381 TaxID=1202962 RepID=A0A5J6WH62_MORMI|nr:DNA/RNA nuclease SfsA [Moritella marina]QFI36451.1 DNA/RNA nuclease SfsA [Moritella marina ATCC 15381]
MQYSSPLQSATLIKRYKRFLADVILENGEEVTIHCANTGAMTGCGDAGDTIWYSTSDNPKRKYSRSWELTEKANGDMICINTARANQLAKEAIECASISQLTGYETLRSEVKYGNENSRIDFLLEDSQLGKCYIEVKSASLLQDDCGYFPDTVSVRGQKHLRELMAVKKSGQRAVLLFVVQHTGITTLKPAKHLDKDYSDLVKQAINQGVEVFAYASTIETDGITLVEQISFNCD